MIPRNAELAELLALEAAQHKGHVAKAYRRASRRAFTWPVEAADVLARTNQRPAANGARLRVLRSVEMNISPDGSCDVDPRTLEQLDIVLGSFHSALRRTEDQTDRYIAALSHPQLHVLGHPRGRIYNFRLGLSAEWPRVFAVAAQFDKAVEIDAYPDRQDLDVALLKRARDAGVRISIAHAHWQLEWVDLGVAAALKAGIAHDRILNLMPLDDLLKWTAEVRSHAA